MKVELEKRLSKVNEKLAYLREELAFYDTERMQIENDLENLMFLDITGKNYSDYVEECKNDYAEYDGLTDIVNIDDFNDDDFNDDVFKPYYFGKMC